MLKKHKGSAGEDSRGTPSDARPTALKQRIMNFVNVQSDAPEYRIPERDIVSAPRCELKRNDRVRFCRIVARVGYPVGVLDDYRLRKTGLYVPSVKVDYEYDEWNPPLLDQIYYQRLLSVDASGGHVLVHPLDVLPLNEKSSLQGVIRF